LSSSKRPFSQVLDWAKRSQNCGVLFPGAPDKVQFYEVDTECISERNKLIELSRVSRKNPIYPILTRSMPSKRVLVKYK